MREKYRYPEEDTEQLDVRKLMASAVRHWYLFVLGLGICVGAAFLYLRYTTPLYVISSKILIKDDKKGPELNGDAVFTELEIFKTSNNIDNELEVLKSKSLMQRVLAELSLQTSFYRPDQIRDVELYGAQVPVRVVVHILDTTGVNVAITLTPVSQQAFLVAYTDVNGQVFSSEHPFGSQVVKPYATFTVFKKSTPASATISTGQPLLVKFHNIRSLATYYNKQLVVEPVSKNASALSLSLKEAVPEKGKDIINKLLELYNREAIEDKNHIATSTIAFLDERLKYITGELTDVEKEVETYKRKKEITDVNSQARLYVDNASESRKQLMEWTIQLDMLESLEQYLQQENNQHALVPSTLNINEATLVGLIVRFNDLQLERERMLRTALPGNPIVQNIDVQLVNLRSNILENLRNVKKGLEITRSSLAQSGGQYSSKIKEVPGIERHLLEINRQQGIKQGLYLYLLQKKEESSLALAATVSNIRIIDPAMAGELPASPNKVIVLLIALLSGIGLPFGLVYLMFLNNDKVQDRKEVVSLTATPILGEISHNNSKNSVVVIENSRIPVAELFRLIRINLSFSSEGKASKVIMVTSSMSGDGKTFFGVNLAASLALTGKKVVVLDLDLRNSGLMDLLKIQQDLGITDYVCLPTMAATDIVRSIEQVPGLYVAGTGVLPENPSEFAMHPRIGQLIEELKESFDHIIIDTAPVGLVADAFLLAHLVDITLYVIRYNHTHKPQIGIIDDIFKSNKLNNPMIVLNDAKKANGYGYGYGYGYSKPGYKRAAKKSKVLN